MAGWAAKKEWCVNDDFFGLIFTQISHLFLHEIHPQRMKKGHLVFNENKSWYVIQMKRILTIGQKLLSQVVKLGGKG